MKKAMLLLTVLVTNGCIRMGLYESPELTKKGTVSTTFGSTVFSVSSDRFMLIPLPDIYFNLGITDNTEISVRYPVYFRTTYDDKNHYLASLGGRLRFSPISNIIFSFGMDLFENSEKEFRPIKVFYPGIAFTDNKREYLAGIYYTLFSQNKLIEDDLDLLQIEFENIVRFYGARKVKFRNDVDVIMGGQLIMPLAKEASPVFLIELAFKKDIF